MITVKQDEFEAFIRGIPDDDVTVGRDVGRTHGMACWYKSGKLVAEERWIRDSTSDPRIFTYKISGAKK